MRDLRRTPETATEYDVNRKDTLLGGPFPLRYLFMMLQLRGSWPYEAPKQELFERKLQS